MCVFFCLCVGAGVRVTGDSHYLSPEEVYSLEDGWLWH